MTKKDPKKDSGSIWNHVQELPDTNRPIIFVFQRKCKTFVAKGCFERGNGWYILQYEGLNRLDSDCTVRFWTECNLPENEGL